MIACSWCGTTTADPPPTWTRQHERGGRLEWLCERCTRDNLRSIEGRLDVDWW